MNEREVHIIDSAYEVFSRYGVQRASMSDIAQAAGISRQTLYNAYANKDEVLRATIRLFTERALKEIEKGLKTRTTLGGQLDLVFQKIAKEPYAIIHASPNAEDIIQGMNAASRDEIENSNDKFCAIIERILTPHKSAIRASKLTLGALADYIQRSTSAMKQQARNQEHLDELLDALKKLVLQSV